MEGMAEFPNTFGSGKYPGNTISYVGRGVGGGGEGRQREKERKAKTGTGTDARPQDVYRKTGM